MRDQIDIRYRLRLRINATDGKFVTIVLPDLPSHLRLKLMAVLKLAFPDFIKHTNSKAQGDKFVYPSLHFSWYNNCLQVSKFF
jgi:hypothetical protein